MDSKNIRLLMFSIILLILSGLGVFFISKINNSFISSSTTVVPTPTQIQIPTLIPTIEITPIATSSTKISVTPTATPSAKTKITPKLTPTIIMTPTSISSPSAIVTPSILNYKSIVDNFSINYSSSRKVYQDTDSTGNRYTFYDSDGNFAVHVSSSGTWSWTNPDRNFNAALIVSGQNTYRYDISTQTIVDLQSSDKNYTIQCVHNGNAALKTECEEFIMSFQLL